MQEPGSKSAAIIVMPYHKALHHDGSLEFVSLGSAYHAINKRVLRAVAIRIFLCGAIPGADIGLGPRP